MQTNNGLLPFQECTVAWVLKQFRDRLRAPKRFLVADEVGLGKTRIASQVIAGLQKGTGSLSVIYVSSSLDISEQNRYVLCSNPEKEVVHVDRVCLLYSDGYRRQGLKIISLTPATSFDLERGTGNIRERAYIARYLARRHQVPRPILLEVLRGAANPDSFEDAYVRTKDNAHMPPKSVCRAIDRTWTSSPDGDLVRQLKSYGSGNVKRGKLVSNLRRQMAKAILGNLRPDLVILDEVQKYPKLIEVDETKGLTHKVAKEVLTTDIPTLLLTATPYRSFVGSNQPGAAEAHVEELKRILVFLAGSAVEADGLARRIAIYADSVRDVKEGTLEKVLGDKKELEHVLMRYMTRTERVNFEDAYKRSFTVQYLKSEIHPITSCHLTEWLKLRNAVTSRRSFLHLWRSGHSPLSYMNKEYKVFDGLKAPANKELLKDRTLYTTLKPTMIHSKLEYLKSDLLADGTIEKYLWIPPTRPYYSGGGIYSLEKLNKVKVKKGLVFSSWSFVPRFVAAELSACKISKRKGWFVNHPLKDSLIGWGRFWHPSLWLAGLIEHADLTAKDQTYDKLHSLGRTRIRTSLEQNGWKLGKGGTKAWEVLFAMDLAKNDSLIRSIIGTHKKRRGKFSLSVMERGSAMPLDIIRRLEQCSPSRTFSKKTVEDLATIALTSPAVCLLRSLISIPVVTAEEMSDELLMMLSDFCLRNWKAYFNREGTARAVLASSRTRSSYSRKMQEYCRDGNIQAVLDEYIFHIRTGKGEESLRKILLKLSYVFGPRGGGLKIRTAKKKPKIVQTEQVSLFGKTDEMTSSRNSIREAFNSPFWPFVLVTTSVGQEGLDFHLYCKDIYHWNLPSSPVDFEQREGRINRFNSQWVRSEIVSAANHNGATPSGFYWDHLYKDALNYSERNDRLNLGMSPHWTYSSRAKVGNRGYVRHILAMPGTEEFPRYHALMSDLTFYRLTLGQPNQTEFMEKLKDNTYLSRIGPSAVTLDLFPYNSAIVEDRLFQKMKLSDRWQLLIKDAYDLLRSLRSRKDYSELEREVKRHVKIVRSTSSDKQKMDSIKALLYFLNPHDQIHDRTPVQGYQDDIRVLTRTNAE
jgi:uncharacterized membrane protein YkvA (DUF1232 family)